MRKGWGTTAAAALALATGGCVSTAATIVKTPFKVAGSTVSWATSGQKRADRREGRRLRHEDERLGREARLRRERCPSRPDDPVCRTPAAPVDGSR